MINESQILKALSKVSDPIEKKNLVTLKAIKQIKISKKLPPNKRPLNHLKLNPKTPKLAHHLMLCEKSL